MDRLLHSALVEYEVRTEHVGPQPLASIRGTALQQQLGDEIRRLLGLVWAELREQRVRTGHSVVVYHGAENGRLLIEVGVQTFSAFTDRGDIRSSATPVGEIATTAHFGDYSAMAPAYEALGRWCRENGRRPSGVSWEVYGDWDDDPAKVRTDIVFLLAPE
jgi:effector-binding domain-containing protein